MLNKFLPCKINQAMKQLSSEHQEILMLVVAQSMSYDQVASYLDISMEDMRATLSDAREALESMMNTPVPKKIKGFNPQSIGFFPYMAQTA